MHKIGMILMAKVRASVIESKRIGIERNEIDLAGYHPSHVSQFWFACSLCLSRLLVAIKHAPAPFSAPACSHCFYQTPTGSTLIQQWSIA